MPLLPDHPSFTYSTDPSDVHPKMTAILAALSGLPADDVGELPNIFGNAIAIVLRECVKPTGYDLFLEGIQRVAREALNLNRKDNRQ